jgi:hypothetical protein
MTNAPNNQRTNYALGIIATIIVAWILWPFLFQSHVPAFRDGYHFYWPQAVWLEASQQSGVYFPKWNFDEGLGASVTGQPTWQLYYPLRCIWFIPWLSLEQRNGLFLAIHVLLAALGIYRTARSLNLNQPASTLAAVAYALCCPVLFQVNNLVYLCSATWIAWAMQSILRLALGSKHAWRFQQHWAGFALEILTLGALMTLSGDPHAAVNFALLLLLAAVWRAFNLFRHRRRSNQTQAIATTEADNADADTLHPSSMDHDNVRPASYAAYVRLTLKIALQVAVVGLAVWQSTLTLEWVAVSSRSAATVKMQDSYDRAINSILGEVKKNQTHSRFDFSISPWNLPSIAMPTWAGHFQPDNSRWVQAIPSEGRMWMPSLYQGFLPLLFAFSAVFLFWLPDSQASIRNVLGVIALLSLLAAMGNYSIAWALRSLLQLIHLNDLAQLLPGDDSGSLYGLLVSIVPGYDSFRYPAKWSVWFAASIALLAGMGLNCWPVERVTANRSITSAISQRIGYLSLAWIISIGAIVTLGQVYREPLESWLRTYPDPLAGYPSYDASLRAVVRGVLHPAIILLRGLATWKLWTIRRSIPKWLRRTEKALKAGGTPAHPARICFPGHGAAWLVVALSTIDLASISPQWVTTVESQTFFAEVDGGHFEILPKIAGLTRVWANTSRADIGMISQATEPTMKDSLELQQQFLQGKLGLIAGDNLNALHASGAIEPQATVTLRRWLQRNDTLQSNQPELDQILAALAVSHRLVWQPSNGGGKLVWQSVKQVKPLCELDTTNNPEPAKSNVRWRIENVDELVIEVQVDKEAILMIHQLNDGLWKLTDDHMQSYSIPPTELWVTSPISAGSHTLRLSRVR